MSREGLHQATAKMRAAGVEETAIRVFAHYYAQLEAGSTGYLREETLEPLHDVPDLAQAHVDDAAARAALDATVVLRLNGGLGTSMGMNRAKTLLPVRPGTTFLDLIVTQLRAARAATGARLPLVMLNSFRTRADTLRHLARYPDLRVDDLPLDLLQNREPKILADTLLPASWPADPSLEWCPPGHGDIYPVLYSSGLLDTLLERGYRYAFSANADNLGAAPDSRLAGWFAASGAPYAAELCRRTPADRKGGHLAVRRSDGVLVLRDTAQTAPEEMDFFTDENHHPYFHTNNLWFDLQALRERLAAGDGFLPLPLIRNEKHLDPADPTSPRVYQVETALGTAIAAFPQAAPVLVPRARFLPVKTTNDLLVLRSDAYAIGADGIPRLTAAAPVVDLDPTYYRTIADFEARFPAGAPSLRAASSLRVRGDWTFGADVVARGAVDLSDPGAPAHVPDGTLLGTVPA